MTTKEMANFIKEAIGLITEKNARIEKLETENKELKEKLKEKANINITMFAIESNIDPKEIEEK
ncbi:hypothetical protein [Metabacillus halosaccharovorans]|uniref:hypothetical protein n=1 Tax=Metabacillus halosaccharovorans TaxID=930124 RepID=UPI0009950AC3|nr:hypothetical protein [Metabacillus halosaccharovorans]